jgi:hypothetical protein
LQTRRLYNQPLQTKEDRMPLIPQTTLLALTMMVLQSCATAVAVLDTAGSAVIYTGKTIVNTVDAITPDIVND